jgi:hypothetical protein
MIIVRVLAKAWAGLIIGQCRKLAIPQIISIGVRYYLLWLFPAISSGFRNQSMETDM